MNFIYICLIIIIIFIRKYRFFNSKFTKIKKENGYLYILSNPCFKKHIYKIGYTNRLNYHARIQELNSSTSLPLSFVIVKVYSSVNPFDLEKLVHKHLNKFRINTRREFFKVRLFRIKMAIRKYN